MLTGWTKSGVVFGYDVVETPKPTPSSQHPTKEEIEKKLQKSFISYEAALKEYEKTKGQAEISKSTSQTEAAKFTPPQLIPKPKTVTDVKEAILFAGLLAKEQAGKKDVTISPIGITKKGEITLWKTETPIEGGISTTYSYKTQEQVSYEAARKKAEYLVETEPGRTLGYVLSPEKGL